jgi:hypothetical protein
MKKNVLIVISTCILLLSFGAATAADKFTQEILLGKWAGSETNARGDTATATFELRPDATFSGVAEMNHKPLMSYSGTWVLNGNLLVWTYTKSSVPMPEAAKVDTDEIASVEKNNLVLVSKLSGKKHLFSRVE